MEQNQLTRSGLEKVIAKVIETENTLSYNLQRAADLVASFKEVAVDRSQNEQVKINLHNWLTTLVESLKPMVKSKKVSISIISNDHDFCLITYPAKLAQVITNLVANCALDAFDSYQLGDANTIDISYKYDDIHVYLYVKDNGCGMPPEMVKNAIEPFITTKRGQGGTGLGLTIVSNIINSVFGGEFTIHSTENLGTEFQLQIPLNT